jgi:hypothetical protein
MSDSTSISTSISGRQLAVLYTNRSSAYYKVHTILLSISLQCYTPLTSPLTFYILPVIHNTTIQLGVFERALTDGLEAIARDPSWFKGYYNTSKVQIYYIILYYSILHNAVLCYTILYYTMSTLY